MYKATGLIVQVTAARTEDAIGGLLVVTVRLVDVGYTCGGVEDARQRPPTQDPLRYLPQPPE